MPDENGRIPPVSIPRIPWQEDPEEVVAQEESAREFEEQGIVIEGPWMEAELPDEAA